MKRATFPLKRPVMVITDYPLQNELDRDIIYSGASNLELLNGLAKAGIMQSSISCTYLSYERPSIENYDFCKSFAKHKATVGSTLQWHQLEHQKDCYVEDTLWTEFQELLEEIRLAEPSLIILAGKWSFFFLTGLFTVTKTMGSGKGDKPMGGLSKYRASVCKAASCLQLTEVILYPVLPPVTKHRMPELAPIMVWDSLKAGDIFKKLKSKEKTINDYLEPNYNLILGTEFDIVSSFLAELEQVLATQSVNLSVDIETRHNTIDCIGLGYRKGEAICIPFSTLDSPVFWTEEQELEIVSRISSILSSENCKIVGQNFSYDAQFLWKFWLGKFHASFDTMIGNHVLYNKMKKSLDVLASVYCEQYLYWKDDQNHQLESVSK